MQSSAHLTAGSGVTSSNQLDHITLMTFDHLIISMVILSFLLIKEGKLSFTGERMCRCTG